MRTLPELAVEWNLKVDALRSFIRRRPALAALGTMIGPTRAYSAKEWERIREEFSKRHAAARSG